MKQKKKTKKKNDVHLMVKKPLKYIEAIKDLNVEYITIHVEINENISEIFSVNQSTIIIIEVVLCILATIIFNIIDKRRKK